MKETGVLVQVGVTTVSDQGFTMHTPDEYTYYLPGFCICMRAWGEGIYYDIVTVRSPKVLPTIQASILSSCPRHIEGACRDAACEQQQPS